MDWVTVYQIALQKNNGLLRYQETSKKLHTKHSVLTYNATFQITLFLKNVGIIYPLGEKNLCHLIIKE